MDHDSIEASMCVLTGSSSDYVRDEKTMLDLHLGNAINLDVVEYLLTKSFTDYDIYVAGYQYGLWREIRPFRTEPKNISIGLLSCTQEMLLQESPKAEMNQTIWRDIILIVTKGLKERDVEIPIVKYEQEIVGTRLLVNALYLNLFRFILQMVCMASEAQRSKKNAIYTGFRINKKTVSGRFFYREVLWDVKCNNQFCIIYDHNSKREYIGTFDSILMLMDTLGQRICLEVGILIAGAARVEGTPKIEEINQIIAIGDTVLKSYGNKGFEFIALFESLIVSVILKKNKDRVTNNLLFYDNCRNELEEMVLDGDFDEAIMYVFDLLADYLTELPNDVLSNIFCIYRIWGHPRVYIKKGMEKVMDKGTAIKVPSDGIARIIDNQFKKMFVTQFYDKHHRYPAVNFSDPEVSYIQQCITIGAPISTEHQQYFFYDWDHIHLQQMWTIPATYDVCHILNDKAVSPDRSELYKSIREGRGTVLGSERRGIIRWLTGKSVKCKDFLDEINEEGLDEDSLIIGMYEKEREIKVKARMFSLMSEKMRMYFVLTEELIAEHLLQYFPQITMKDPLHVQIKKLWSVSGSSSLHSLDPVINVDFEKWNLNFREELTNLVFATMDSLFGYSRLISRTHEIFYNSYIYACSGKYLPKATATGLAIDPPMAYTNHMGGFEGLRQKGWTIATVCLLCYIADNLKISMSLLGQGDNQVVRLYMPQNYWNNLGYNYDKKTKSAKEKLTEYLSDMDRYFGAAGLPIKIRETWTSTRLCMYGKSMFMDGNCMPQWIKKLLRTYALSNEGTLTISGVIGTIATNMSAAAHASSSPDVMYVIFLIFAEWSLEFLFAYHPFTRKTIEEGGSIDIWMPTSRGRKKVNSGKINLTRLIVTILTVPTSVGGSITIPLTSFIMRGFPDHASEGYAWLKLLSSVKSPWQYMFKRWYSFIPNETIEFDMLVQSPWSLNHKKPPTPGLQSREVVRDWLLSGQFSQNTFIRNVKTIMSTFDRKKVCKLFCTEEINPLILNELYCTFPQVYLDSVLRRVENTRTITKVAMKMGSNDPIVKVLMKMEHEFIGYLYWRGMQTGKVYSECATEQCRQARNNGWGRIIKGLTTPHPIEYALSVQCSSTNIKCDGSDYVYVRIDPEGSFPPYLGSNVKTKVMSLQDPSARSEPLISTSSKLAKFAPWLELGPNTIALIEQNVSIVCNTEIFDNFFDSDHTFFSGSVEHRYNPACASEGCFINYSPQVGSTVFLSTDNMPRYGKGQKNVTLNFQALFCILQYFSSRRDDTTCLHYHIRCEDCIKEVDDKLTDISDFSEEFERIYRKEVTDKLTETLGFLNVNPSREKNLTQVSKNVIHVKPLRDMNLKSLNSGVTWFLGVKAAKMIMYSRKTSTSMINQEDLQAFPRVYSYKISSVRVIKCCVSSCLAIKQMRMQRKGRCHSFEEVKRKLKNQMIKITLDKFKGIASLCIGRTYDLSNNESPVYYNTGEFPENVVGFTNAIRSEMIEQLDLITGYERDIESWVVPLAGMSLLDQCLLIRIRLLAIDNCSDCLEALDLIENSQAENIDCGQLHIKRELKRCTGVMIPLDSVIKRLDLKAVQIKPKMMRKGSMIAHALTWCYQGSVQKASNMIKMGLDPRLKTLLQQKEGVILPTRAAYKWDIMLSLIQHINYHNIIVLGDGTGFTSAVCARRFPESRIFPSGLLENGKMIPQDLQSIRPFASRVYTNVNSTMLETVCDDITKPRWKQEFESFVSSLTGNILIISDIEGRGNLETILSNLAKNFSKSEEIGYIFKAYFGTFICPKTSKKYSNWLCNLRYQEGFVSNIEVEVQKIACVNNEISNMSIPDISEKMISVWLNIFHGAYDELYEISLKIAFSALHRCMFVMDRKEFSYNKEIILVRALNYLSANFKVPYEGMSPGDDRRLVDGILCKIIKGYKILLMIVYGREISRRQYFRKLGISRSEPEKRQKHLKRFQLILVEWDREISLSDKEIRAAQVIRTMYLRDSPNSEDDIVPSTLTELYVTAIIPGDKINKHLRL
ncbi:TPA_asm: polyprotein [Artemisia virus 1]|uniref:Replicase n=1 Tax=Artemisia virus 1 TaxID=2977954 RepID=A0A9N7AB28_9RHAB|nr:TPA_asm: polyprotein [Artemisia virus 1]